MGDMKMFFLVIFLLVTALVADALSVPNRVTCYARAGLGIYDVHGVHEGVGENIWQASADAMKDCRSQHPFIGCVPIPGCK